MAPRKIGYVVKRTIDYSVAGSALVLCAPLMAAIAAAIKADSPGKILFVQERLGRDGRVFRLLKFRTMRDAPIRFNADGSTRVDPGDDRVTRVGRYLRGALDELPQLVNVLRGDMSLVGPRPDMASQRTLYDDRESRKLEMLPGITSLAIVIGRTELPWRERLLLDVVYVDHWSVLLDLKILAQTLLMPFGMRPFGFSGLTGRASTSSAD